MKKIIGTFITLFFVISSIIMMLNFNGCTSKESDTNEFHQDFSDTKRVLLISSYSPSFQTFFDQIQGIQNVFEPYNIVFDVEFMDTKRLLTEENLSNFHTSLTYKLSKFDPYDLVMTSDDNAINYVSQHKDELFPNTPIVFLGVNNLDNASSYSQDPYITGVLEAPSIKETIIVAKRLEPKATKVIAIVDNTPSGQSDIITFYKEENKIDGLDYQVLDLSTMDFYTFYKELESIDDTGIILLLSAFKDNTSKEALTFESSIQHILSHTDQPVYHPYSHGIGDGLVGGKVISHFYQGQTAAKMALTILQGTNPSVVKAVFESPNRFVYDVAALEAYNLPINQLPIIYDRVNYKPTILEKYATHISVIVLIVFMQSIAILLLYRLNNARVIAEEKLHISHNELALSNKKLHESNINLAQTNEELTATYEEVESQNKQIHDLIYIDSLTGLGNRYAINDKISQLAKTRTHNLNILIFMDVDNFKNINDTFGHDFGDLIIQATGERLSTLKNPTTDIARFGGDEFIVLSRDFVDRAGIEAFVKSVQNLFNHPVNINDKSIYLTISIGIVIHPIDGHTESELLKMADMALYQAKNQGKNCYVFYKKEMSTNLEEKLTFQSELKKATKNQAFHLNFQPIIKAESLKPVSYEALIRWNSSIYGSVSPLKLIQNAEKLGLIIEIGDFVLRESCKFIRKVNEHSLWKSYVSVNVSPRQFMYDDFYKRVVTIIEEEGCTPSMICFEITESALLESINSSFATIEALKNKGFGIALDDFGTGYSSLSYFRDLPITIIKIDKSFVEGIDSNSYNQKFVKSIIGIAREKEIIVVAEGVETKEELATLNDLNCDCFQGYYFSKPLPYEDALNHA